MTYTVKFIQSPHSPTKFMDTSTHATLSVTTHTLKVSHTHTPHTYTHTQSHKADSHDASFSVETLLDAMLILYEECTTCSFKREKTVAEFVESSE